MYKTTLYIGHNIGDCAYWTHSDVCTVAADILALNAFSAYEISGYWQGKPEQTTVLIVMGAGRDADTIARAIPALAYKLEQDSILYEVERVSAEFVSAPKQTKVV